MNQNKKHLKDLTSREKIALIYNQFFIYCLKKGAFDNPNHVTILQSAFKLLDDDLKKNLKK